MGVHVLHNVVVGGVHVACSSMTGCPPFPSVSIPRRYDNGSLHRDEDWFGGSIIGRCIWVAQHIRHAEGGDKRITRVASRTKEVRSQSRETWST